VSSNQAAIIRERITSLTRIPPGRDQSRTSPAVVQPPQVTIVPFYDRSGLIHETLDTLKTALSEEILVTINMGIIICENILTRMDEAGPEESTLQRVEGGRVK